MQIEPNTWLISNSQLYFANSIVKEKRSSLSPYSLFDLSNLMECILLADKIITLPGIGVENDISQILKDKDILYELNVEEDIVDIITSLKSSWDADSIISQHRDKFVTIICNVFPIEKETAIKAISKSNEWANTTYDTPNWSIAKELTLRSLKDEDFAPLQTGTNFLFKTYGNIHPKTIENIVTKTFVRALLYFKIASASKLNYYPDSIRTSLTACLNTLVEETVYKYVKNILTEIDKTIKEQVGSIYERVGFTKTEVTIPSSFSTVIATCKNRDEIIDKALELRNSNDLKKCRQWLSEYEVATKTFDIKKIDNMTKQISLLQNPKEYDTESLIINSIPSITDIISLDITKSVEKGVSTGIGLGIGKINEYLKTKNLIFLRNLTTQYNKVISSKEHIESIFDSKLLDEDLEVLKNLMKTQSEYIHPIKKEIETNSKEITLDNSNQKPSSLSIADELQKLANLKNEGILSEEEFNNLKQKLIKRF